MRVKCKKCGQMTNQPITEITRKGQGKRPYMPICKACYDRYREQWDAADIDRITKSTRKTVTGRKAGDITLVKGMAAKKRTVSPIYVSTNTGKSRAGYFYGFVAIGGGKKLAVKGSTSEDRQECADKTLEYARKYLGDRMNEDIAREYLESRDLVYTPPSRRASA